MKFIMNKRFTNIRKKINNLIISNKYYVRIPLEKKTILLRKIIISKQLTQTAKKKNLLEERKIETL